MSPEFFNPGPNPHGNPPIFLAAVGELMTAVAGRVADRMLCHSFTTEAYLRERTLPALLAARGDLDGFTLCLPVLAAFAVSGSPARVAATIKQRFGDVVDRISLYAPYAPDPAELRAVTAALRP